MSKYEFVEFFRNEMVVDFMPCEQTDGRSWRDRPDHERDSDPETPDCHRRCLTRDQTEV